MLSPAAPAIGVRLPVAYIRRSISRAGDRGDTSREFQTDAIRALAGADTGLRIIDQDWGRSAATDATDQRLAFLGLMDEVQQGRVSTLYAYSLDRLARSVEWSARLWNECRRHDVPIVTTEGHYTAADPAAWDRFHFEAMMNERNLMGMKAKAKAVAAKRRSRGDALGRAPYGFTHKLGVDDNGKPVSRLVRNPAEDVDRVVDAFRATGGWAEAARRLTLAGVRTRFGTVWDPSTVKSVVERAAPELVPPAGRARGRRAGHETHALAGLIRCPYCSRILTPERYSGGKRRVRWYCRQQRLHGHAGNPVLVREDLTLLPWAKAEAARASGLISALPGGAEAEAKRIELEAKRQRILDLYADGDIGRQDKTARMAVVDTALAALTQQGQVMDVLLSRPVVPWDDPAEANRLLRTMWQRIELDPDTRPMTPARAVWFGGYDPDAPDIDPETGRPWDPRDATK